MRTTLESAADKTMPAKTVPAVGVPSAPALPADLEALLRRLRLPHVRRHAPEMVATAKAQHCEPVETLKALLVEEVAGRERSALATRRSAAGFPTGKIHRTGRAAVAGRTGASTASLPGSTAPRCREPASPDAFSVDEGDVEGLSRTLQTRPAGGPH